jgi:hypothetical protein
MMSVMMPLVCRGIAFQNPWGRTMMHGQRLGRRLSQSGGQSCNRSWNRRVSEWLPRSRSPRRIALGSLAALLLGSAAQAVTLANGKTYFTQPPQLVRATTSFNSKDFPSATYFFTLTLPDTAGEPLQKLVITQAEGPDRPIWLGDRSEVFDGAGRRGTKVATPLLTVSDKGRSLTVQFDPPIAPGRTVTLALYPVRNPDTGGVYLYGVTAFPVGDQAQGQFLGYGRIHIYDSFHGGFW